MSKKLKFTESTPTEAGFYYVITNQYPVKVEVIYAGVVQDGAEQDLIVRYNRGKEAQDVKMANMPPGSRWAKVTQLDILNKEIIQKLSKGDWEAPIFVCDRETGKEYRIDSISSLTNGNDNKILVDINTDD